MPPDPRPDPDPDRADAPEPAGSGSQPAPGSGGACWSDEEEESSAYIAELMAAVAAGEDLITDDIAGAGFAQGGTADQMCPGPDLATLIHAATTSDKILATVSDAALIGILRGVRRLPLRLGHSNSSRDGTKVPNSGSGSGFSHPTSQR